MGPRQSTMSVCAVTFGMIISERNVGHCVGVPSDGRGRRHAFPQFVLLAWINLRVLWPRSMSDVGERLPMNDLSTRRLAIRSTPIATLQPSLIQQE